jgi:hypothetical protein
MQLLYDEASYIQTLKISQLIKKRLTTFVLLETILNNNLFFIEKKDTIREQIYSYESVIGEGVAQELTNYTTFNLQQINLGDVYAGMQAPDFSKYDINKIKTVIMFVIPYRVENGVSQIKIDDKSKIEFCPVTNLFDDPIYAFLDSIGTNPRIEGVPFTYFSDSIGRISACTQVMLTLDEFYHPDFEIQEGKFEQIDLSKEKAKRGGKYSPHKDLILEKLWLLQDSGKSPIEVDRQLIDSNFISNYLVSYFSHRQELIHHQIHLITNVDSYIEARNRYMESISKHYFGDNYNDLRELVFDTEISSNSVFHRFCVKLLELTLKKAIELGGLHQTFWNTNGQPISEPEAQPIIYNQLRFIAEIKGINVSRETVAADGSLDFFLYYCKNDKPMKVCVELKNAHHQNLEHGINTQLPLYIKDVGKNEGIFLVLWYKCDGFRKPIKYTSIQELEESLVQEVPSGQLIKVMVVDCTKKLPPSDRNRLLTVN